MRAWLHRLPCSALLPGSRLVRLPTHCASSVGSEICVCVSVREPSPPHPIGAQVQNDGAQVDRMRLLGPRYCCCCCSGAWLASGHQAVDNIGGASGWWWCVSSRLASHSDSNSDWTPARLNPPSASTV